MDLALETDAAALEVTAAAELDLDATLDDTPEAPLGLAVATPLETVLVAEVVVLPLLPPAPPPPDRQSLLGPS